MSEDPRGHASDPAAPNTHPRIAVAEMPFLLIVRIAPLFSLALCLVSCVSSSSFHDLPDILDAHGISYMPNSTDYPDADAVIIVSTHDSEMGFTTNRYAYTTETVHVVMKLFRNVEKYAFVELPVYRNEELSMLRARTINDLGVSTVLQSSDFHKIKGRGTNSVFYSDREWIRFTFANVTPGCIIEYSYRKRVEVPFVFDSWIVQSTVPIIYARYRLTVPSSILDKVNGPGWEWNYRIYNSTKLHGHETIKPVNKDISDKVTFQWVRRDVEPFEPEPSMPPAVEYVEHIRFALSSWSSWDDIAGWYYEDLFTPQLVGSRIVYDKTESLTTDAQTDHEKIDAIRGYVQQLRYVAIEIGPGNVVPNLPQKVLQRGYGDCKDKSILTVAMLRHVGIKASPVLVRTRNVGRLDTKFPSFSFNHMIVLAETGSGREYWIDPTASMHGTDDLPWPCENIDVLVLADDGSGEVRRTPGKTCEDNVSDHDMRIVLDRDLGGRIKLKLRMRGEAAAELRWTLSGKSHEDRKQLFKDELLQLSGGTITFFDVQNLDSFDKDLLVECDVEVEHLARRQGDLVFLNDLPFEPSKDFVQLSEKERRYPIVLGYERTFHRSIEIDLSQTSLTFRSFPPEANVSYRLLSFGRRYSWKDAKHAKGNEVLEVKTPVLGKEYYEIARSVSEALKPTAAMGIVLKASVDTE